MFKVLIVAHNKIIETENDKIINHWYSEIIYNILVENNMLNAFYETVDIQNGGTYRSNVFSDDFINDHINDYDVIICPDCGGEWYTLQESRNYNDFTKLIIKLTKMLKPEGLLLLDKFIYHEFRELTLNLLIDELNYIIYEREYIMFGQSFHNFILAKK